MNSVEQERAYEARDLGIEMTRRHFRMVEWSVLMPEDLTIERYKLKEVLNAARLTVGGSSSTSSIAVSKNKNP